VIDLLDRGSLKLEYVKWLVLDEADEMLSMGFIDDVEKFSKLHQLIARQLSSRNDAAIDSTVGDKVLRSPVTVTVEQPKAAPAKNQSAYWYRALTKAKALQRILNWKTRNRL